MGIAVRTGVSFKIRQGPNRLGGPEIDHQLVAGRLLERLPGTKSWSSNTAAGYELWDLCNDCLLFHQSHNARPVFCSLSRRDNVQGGPYEHFDS